MKNRNFNLNVVLIIIVLLIISSCTSCSETKSENKDSNDFENILSDLSKIDYTGSKDECYCIIKCKLINITEVKYDNSVLKEKNFYIDLSTIPYVKFSVLVEKSTVNDLINTDFEITMVKGTFSEKFLNIGNEYIFDIVKGSWNIDTNLIYRRVNALLINKNENFIINDEGEKKPLSFEDEIFK